MQGLDVTRVLSRVTVTCTSENPPKSFVEPLVVSEPPFVVESTTDIPFLARVVLDWNCNGQKNAQTVVEHWVQVSRIDLAPGKLILTDFWHRQIDRLRTGYATFGQEQLLDIELDRNTPLAPQRDNNISWQTPSQSVAKKPTPMPIPTGSVTDETEVPNSGIPVGTSLLCDPSNDDPAEASGRILTIGLILTYLLTVRGNHLR